MPDQDIPNLNDEIQAFPEDMRRDLANQGRNDLYWFAKAVMGYGEMTRTCHGPLCAWLDGNPTRMKMILMPRGHFKTSVATIARTVQRLVRDPNARQLIVNETSTNAQRFLSAIKQNAESNRVFRTLYSEIIPKKPTVWSAESLIFNRDWAGPEPSIDTLGMTGAMTSRHFTHITIDDPISEEAAKSEAVMHDAITRIDKIFSLFVRPEWDSMDLIGTRWAYYDVYSHFREKLRTRLAIFARAAIEEGEPIFPELLSLDTLADIRNFIGEYSFSCLYMNNPRDEGMQDFNIKDIRFWQYSSDEESLVLHGGKEGEYNEVFLNKLDITVTVDLALAESVDSDRNAIVVCGVTPLGQAIVLYTWAERCSPLVVIDKILEVTKIFRPRAVGLEVAGYQRALKYHLLNEAARQGIYVPIRELKSLGKKDEKTLRIRGLQPLCATGRLYLLPTMHMLRNEMAEFPLGKHDDVLDALAMHQMLWTGIMSPLRWQKYKESERKVLRAIRLQNQGLSVAGVGLSPVPTGRRNARDIPSADDLGIDEDQDRYSEAVDFVVQQVRSQDN